MKYNPLLQKTFKYEMGLKSLALEDWLDWGLDTPAQLQRKAELLKTHRNQVLGQLPGSEDASRELLEFLSDYLPRYIPSQFRREDKKLYRKDSGTEICLTHSADTPLALLASLVSEDFCLLRTENQNIKFEAGLVCFPSRWKLEEKLGKGIPEIHAPVPGFQDQLQNLVTRFLCGLSVERPMWRLNWSIHDSMELFAYGTEASKKPLSKDNILSQLFLRVEKQGFLRLPKTQFVVFSIRTFIQSLEEALPEEQDKAQANTYLESIPLPVLQYKGMEGFYKMMVEALS